ncbi:hypothetical protein S40288_00178 [Stachybotrys chartarum IBT 40288]|nr:hypothetical protein S40288_00178 [Stachybotrys chartarum IBT 40288]
MFRDESSKVIQKAHAQWGVGDGPDELLMTQETASTSSSLSSLGSHTSPSTSLSPSSPPNHQAGLVAVSNSATVLPDTGHLFSMQPSMGEQGIKFFFTQYVLGHPDEPRTLEELRSTTTFSAPGLQDIMAAVGLASLGNLHDRPDLMVAARRHYGSALRLTRQAVLNDRAPSLDVTVRSIVTLAIFELVNGNGHAENVKTAQTHIAGGVALMRAWCPMPNTATGGIRGMIQLCYSMFMACYLGGTKLPPTFGDWIAFMRSMQPPEDYPSTDLGLLMARITDLAVFVRNHALSDGRPTTTSIIQELVDLDREFLAWEQGLEGYWLHITHKSDTFPPEAVFEGEYHTYYDMWSARMWAHYRWARLLLNQILLEITDSSPVSTQAVVPVPNSSEIIALLRKLARDTLVSIPNHWRHPLLGDKMPATVDRQIGAGSGPAGIGLLIYQLKAAACAAKVPIEYGHWAQGILECIWRDMGIMRARSILEDLRAHLLKRGKGITVAKVMYEKQI